VIVQLSAAIAVTIVLATISHYVIERPFLKLKSSLPRPHTKFTNESSQFDPREPVKSVSSAVY
jgi:peptidoglycan/LPS O-acetylase OafA/YrhL